MLERGKLGQVTVFVIIAIIVVAGIAAFFVLKDKLRSTEPQIPAEIQPVYDFVNDCLETTAENGLAELGMKGGYFSIKNDTPFLDLEIPYYLFEGKDYTPDKQFLEKELSEYMNFALPFCMNLDSISSNFQIKSKPFLINVSIEPESTIFNLNYPLTIKKGESEFELQYFKEEIPVRLGVINAVSKIIINKKLESPTGTCLSCLYDLSDQYGLNIDFYEYSNSTVYTLNDKNSQINNWNYRFTFAIK